MTHEIVTIDCHDPAATDQAPRLTVQADYERARSVALTWARQSDRLTVRYPGGLLSGVTPAELAQCLTLEQLVSSLGSAYAAAHNGADSDATEALCR